MTSLSSIWSKALGELVLWIPAGLGSKTLTKAVLKLGADPNAGDGLPMYSAITGGGKTRGTKAVKALLEGGATIQDFDMWWAKRFDNPETIAVLEEAMQQQGQPQGPNVPRQG